MAADSRSAVVLNWHQFRPELGVNLGLLDYLTSIGRLATKLSVYDCISNSNEISLFCYLPLRQCEHVKTHSY